MSDAELQEEEREVLSSIYEGDPAFKQLTPTTFQYKVHQWPSSFDLSLTDPVTEHFQFCVLKE